MLHLRSPNLKIMLQKRFLFCVCAFLVTWLCTLTFSVTSFCCLSIIFLLKGENVWNACKKHFLNYSSICSVMWPETCYNLKEWEIRVCQNDSDLKLCLDYDSGMAECVRAMIFKGLKGKSGFGLVLGDFVKHFTGRR